MKNTDRIDTIKGQRSTFSNKRNLHLERLTKAQGMGRRVPVMTVAA
jgi:hypothetical protein